MKSQIVLAAAFAAMITPVAALEYHPVQLSKFAVTPPDIRQALVVDSRGNPIGIVSKVRVNGAGAPQQIEILRPGAEIMDVSATTVQYDFESNRLLLVTPTLRTPA